MEAKLYLLMPVNGQRDHLVTSGCWGAPNIVT